MNSKKILKEVLHQGRPALLGKKSKLNLIFSSDVFPSELRYKKGGHLITIEKVTLILKISYLKRQLKKIEREKRTKNCKF